MPRDDPADTGGLFIGRRPGSAPLKYRGTPQRSGSARQRVDGTLALVVLLVEVVLCASCWGPQPLGWLWIASQVNYLTDSVFVGIIVAFMGLLATVLLTLSITSRLDGLWRILRRAAGHDQKEGVLGRIFMWTAIVAGGAFAAWLILIQGPGSSIGPAQGP
jgi:hypothetical protein